MAKKAANMVCIRTQNYGDRGAGLYLRLHGGTRYMGLSLYVAIGFSKASYKIASESIFFIILLLESTYSTAEILAPKAVTSSSTDE